MGINGFDSCQNLPGRFEISILQEELGGIFQQDRVILANLKHLPHYGQLFPESFLLGGLHKQVMSQKVFA